MGTQPPPRKGAYCKHIQVLHKDQYRSIQSKHSQEILLLESVKSFFKQRFALEKQHFESLSKICSSQYRAFECLKKLPSNDNNEVRHDLFLIRTLHYRIVVQCTFSFLGPKSSPYVLIRYRTFIIFGKKIHPV